jgi:hypothetical protein
MTTARRAHRHPGGGGFWINTRITPDTLPQVGRLAAALARDRGAGSRADLFGWTAQSAAAGVLGSGEGTFALWEDAHELVCRVVRETTEVVGGPGSVAAVRFDGLDAVLVVHGGEDDVVVRLAV